MWVYNYVYVGMFISIYRYVYLSKCPYMCVCVWVYGITPLKIAGRFYRGFF